MTEPTKFAEKVIAGENLLSLTDDAVECITKGEFSIADLLETLEPYLTNINVEERGNGVLFLANVLELMPKDLLNEDEMNVISVYLIAKLGDHFSIVPQAIKALSFAVGMSNFPQLQVLHLLGSFQMNVTVQTLTQSGRLCYYEIMKKLFNSQKKVLKTKTSDYIYAIIAGMDTEGDPRNLVFLFQLIPEIYSEFSLDHLAEEAFSVLECYFPIDFTPKSDDGITREQLADGLLNCLSSTKEFGPYIFSMILEKLESALRVAQVDALKLLVKGFNIWTVENINPHVAELWKSFKQLTLQSGDHELVELATKALIGLIKKFSTSAITSNESVTVNGILKTISRETHRFLADPSLNLFLPATKLLAGVAEASSTSCDYVVKTVVPQLLALTEGNKGNVVVLNALTPILSCAVRFHLWKSDETRPILESLPSTLIDLMTEPNMQSGCFLCFNEIIPILTPDLRGDLYRSVSSFLSRTDLMPQDTYLPFLTTLSTTYPNEVKVKLLEDLTVNSADSAMSKMKKIRTMCWCCDVSSLTEYCSGKIMNYIKTTESTVEAIDCLRDYVVHGSQPPVLRRLGKQCQLIVKLHKTFVDVPDISKKSALESKDIFVSVSIIIATLMRHLNSKEQKEIISSCFELHSLKTMEVETKSDFSANQIQILKGLLISLRKGVVIDNLSELVQVLVKSRGTTFCRLSSSILISSLVNKCSNDSDLNYILDCTASEIDNGLSGKLPSESIILLSWVVKSLILRSHPLAEKWLLKLIDLLDRPDISTDAANGFAIILSDSDELSSANFCTERLLFKQWIFQWVFNERLQNLFNSGNESAQKAASLAIAHIVIAAPSGLVVAEISKLIKVFVLCMESQSSEVTSATLQILAKLLATEEKAFEEYIDTFIPRMLATTHSDSMTVKIRALECIYHYGKYQEIKLLPYRNQVTQELVTCLDDRKRLVRQKAGQARSRWFLVGALDDR